MTVALSPPAFAHAHAAHCESGVMANLMRHHGVPISEALAFGLSSALAFAYVPFIKVYGQPMVSYRMPPKSIVKGLLRPLATRFRFETFRSPQAGQARLDTLIAQGHVVGLQTSVYWLPYFPPDMRFHFNAHNLLVYGKDGDDYLISDPVFEEPQRCAAADLQRARFARGLLAPKGLLYFPTTIGRTGLTPERVRAAIRRNCRTMLAPVPLAGVRAMRALARRVERAPADAASTPALLGHIVRMQEEIGTGGAGFRFLYAAFLQEAAPLAERPQLAALAERLTTIGDGWRVLALKAARMVKGRDAVDPPAIATLLRRQADDEAALFRDLLAVVR